MNQVLIKYLQYYGKQGGNNWEFQRKGEINNTLNLFGNTVYLQGTVLGNKTDVREKL